MNAKVWKLLGLILIAVFALSIAHSVYGFTVIATIPVGTPGTDNPYDYGAVYDSGKGEVFVTNAGSDTVSVISDKTNAVIATVPMRFAPYALAYDSAKGEIFVANGNAQTTLGTVSVISDSTNTVVANITVGTDPGGIAYDPSKGEIFVSNTGDTPPDMSVISDNTNTVVAIIPVQTEGTIDDWPQGVAYDSGTGNIYVAIQGYDAVDVISDSTNAVVANITTEFPHKQA